MSQDKYIGTKDAARLTGLSMQEIYALIHKGTITAHKAPKMLALSDLSNEQQSFRTIATLSQSGILLRYHLQS